MQEEKTENGNADKPTEEFLREYARLKPLYSGALKTACSRFEILDDEFSFTHGHDPIHHIESRLKTPESCYEKLRRRGYGANARKSEKTDGYRGRARGVRLCGGYLQDRAGVSESARRAPDTQERLYRKTETERLQKPASYRGGTRCAFVRGYRRSRGNTVAHDFHEYVGESRTRSLL